jgi:glutamine synthetase
MEALKDLIRTSVLPAAYRQQGMIAESINAYAEAAKAAGSSAGAVVSQAEDLEEIARLIATLKTGVENLERKAAEASSIDSLEKKAHFYAYEVMDVCQSVRETSDKIEEVVDDQFWPLPKYREMLFLI